MLARSLLSGLFSAAAIYAAPVAAAQGVPTCFGQSATIVGTSAADDIDGTGGPDVIVGLGGADTIRGHGGRDLICGNGGEDTLRGGSGADKLSGGPSGEGSTSIFHGGPGDDLLLGGDQFDEFWPEPGVDVIRGRGSGSDVVRYDTAKASVRVDLREGVATGQGKDTIRGVRSVIGSSHADFIAGDDRENQGRGNALIGNGGADRILGRGGDDVLVDGRVLHEGGVGGSAGADILRGGPGSDSIHFGDGDDQVFGGGRYDIFFVEGSGDDRISGGRGPDLITFYNVGPVQVSLITGRATTPGGTVTFSSIRDLQGSRFDDTLIGDGGKNQIGGEPGNDTLYGRGGDDLLSGGGDDDGGPAGNDTLFGGSGDDDLNGWSGVNMNDGGPGTDTCVNPDTAGGAVNCESP
jgi:Ca2+-binding RTX toxin-like protein